MRYGNGKKARVGQYVLLTDGIGNTRAKRGVYTVTKLMPKRGLVEIAGRDSFGPVVCSVFASRIISVTDEEAMIWMLEQ